MNVHDFLRDRLLLQAGLAEPQAAPFSKADFERLWETEWSPQFEQLMRNRLVMGAFRYGLLAEKKVKGKKWDLVDPIKKKVELYESTGNTEYLVDAANYCLLAFECDNHPTKHFKALDDHHDHCKRRRGERRVNGNGAEDSATKGNFTKDVMEFIRADRERIRANIHKLLAKRNPHPTVGNRSTGYLQTQPMTVNTLAQFKCAYSIAMDELERQLKDKAEALLAFNSIASVAGHGFVKFYFLAQVKMK